MASVSLDTKRAAFLQELQERYRIADTFIRFYASPFSKKLAMVATDPIFLFQYLKKRQNTSGEAFLFYGEKITLDADSAHDNDANTIRQFGVLPSPSEQKVTQFLVRNLQPDDIFYDIGANFGFYTHLAHEFCTEVHAFEPLPDAFRSMQKDLAGTHGIYLNEVALSSTSGTAVLYTKNDHSGGSSLVDKDETLSGELTVRTLQLDEYVSSHTAPTIIKIDVEGAEELVLRGATGVLHTENPTIIMEIWSYGARPDAFPRTLAAISLLRSFGFKSFEITKDGDALPYHGDFREPGESGDPWGDNYIFKK